MFKMIVTKAAISQGYNGAPALRFSENSEVPSVKFKIGYRMYDKRAENEHRYINITVKAFGNNVEKIRNMKLDAKMYVNIIGRYDVDTWEDKTTHESKSEPVLMVDEIEYSEIKGNGKQEVGNNGSPASGGQGQSTTPAGNDQPPDNFSGFEGFSGPNPFFPDK